MLTLGVNGAIKTNVFVPSVNASVRAGAQCEYTLQVVNPRGELYVLFQSSVLSQILLICSEMNPY